MDDLAGLDWSKPDAAQPKPKPSGSTIMNPSYPSLRPTPSPANSGRSTPASLSHTAAPAVTATKPAQDSFSNLLQFAAPSKPKQNLSLAERQAQLEAEKRRKEEERRKQAEAQFGTAQQWDALGSRSFTPNSGISALASAPVAPNAGDDEEDLFAAFNKDTKVDNSSHFPPPERQHSVKVENQKPLDLSSPSAWAPTAPTTSSNGNGHGDIFDDHDDPFGLGNITTKTRVSPSSRDVQMDDDDFLGDLGKPIEEVRMKQRQQQQQQHRQPEPGKPIELDESSSSDEETLPPRQRARESEAGAGANKDLDRAMAQLVEYGFSPEDARRGLSQSGAGLNVQAAANWLLDDAHRRAKQKSQGRSSSAGSGRSHNQSERRTAEHPGRGGGEPDLAKSAAAVGTSLFKTANSLWKTGQKKMAQAVAELQQDGGDPSQPKWMRDAQQGRTSDARPSHREGATDEALALESGGRPSQSRSSSRPTAGFSQSRTSSPSASLSAGQSRHSPAPRWQQQGGHGASDARARLNRMKADDDDDSFSSYVSASRRKKTTPTTTPTFESRKAQDSEPDLLFNGSETARPSQPIPQRPAQRQPPAFVKQTQFTPPASRKTTPQPPRQVPPISPADLQSSNSHRIQGTAHFKRGDYASAHSSYAKSLSSIPAAHPLLIVLLTNRALTALKTGEPKQAVQDADEALKLIGPGNGQGETVSVQAENGQEEARSMKELYGKALCRKAEALEQMEKWAEAGSVWKQCVESGVGGPTAVKGRQRCQAALAPKPRAAPPKPATAAARRPVASLIMAPARSSEAVTRLREANEAAAREDDEKFALADKVDARVSAWRDGKRDNLRGLIASLDQVLWEGSGWKRVGLHELVVANKVKISYMKAIAKTHPDKVSTARNSARGT